MFPVGGTIFLNGLKLSRQIILILATLLAVVVSRSDQDGGDHFDSEHYNIRGPLNPLQVKALAESIYTKDLSEDIDAIQKLANYDYLETALELVKRLRHELIYRPDELKDSIARDYLIGAILTALTHNAVQGDFNNAQRWKTVNPQSEEFHRPLLDEIDLAIEDIVDLHVDIDYEKKYADKIISVLSTTYDLFLRRGVPMTSLVKRLRQNPSLRQTDTNIKSSVPPISGDTVPRDKRISPSNAEAILQRSALRSLSLAETKNRIAEMKKILEARVIEQPEVIEYLLSVERKDYLFERSRPEVAWLMGLPGGGKDTIAEAYTEAMHPKDKNWNDHVYLFNIIRTNADLWQELGSTTGHVGSDAVPPFIRWAVEHSGGKYILEPIPQGGGKPPEYKVVLNKEWSGENLIGTVGPDRSVLFLNEFHDWGYNNKNKFAKQLIEKGIIPINNPNGGLNVMQLNFNIIIASNDGIGLLADRHIDGRPRGKRQSFSELIEKWSSVFMDKNKLKAEITKIKGGSANEHDRKGTSEEFLSRVYNVFLLRPLSPEGLAKIAEIHLNKLKRKMENINKNIGKITLSWGESVVRYIQEFQYEAEENARPIEGKVTGLVEKTINKALFDGTIKPNQKGQDIEIDISELEDGTSSLKVGFKASGSKGELENVELPIDDSQALKFKKPLTQDEIDKLASLSGKMKEQVFGLDHVIDKLTEAIIYSEMERNVNLNRVESKLPAANVYGFFGLSSTGKTEITKVLAESLTGDRDSFWTVTGNMLKTPQAWEEHFGYDQEDPDKSSKFQKEFDRRNGRLIVVLDELPEASKEGLKILYDYLRESEVGGRKMAGVTFLITGNAGQEWYEGIPSRVPETERHFSMLEIYRKAIKNERDQEVLLLKYFPEALVKRIGMSRIFFFPPMDFKPIRQLFYLKMKLALKSEFGKNKEKNWYKIQFGDKANFVKLIETFEKEGFALDGQGASIDHFVKNNFARKLKLALMTQWKVENGSDVVVTLNEELTEKYALSKLDDDHKTEKGVYLDVFVPSKNQTFSLFIEGKPYILNPPTTEVEQVFVAYHEAGHELVRKVLLGDKFKSEGITVIPGVVDIEGRWIYYLGLAKSEELEYMEKTREAVVRNMGVLMGGWLAQQITSKDGHHDAGKHNDIDRATEMARMAILHWGLSEAFGREAVPHGVSPAEYAANLKGERALLYQRELQKILREAEQMALEALMVNYKTLVLLGSELGRVGDMKERHMDAFYEKHMNEVLTEWEPDKEQEYIKRALMIRNEEYTRNEVGEALFSDQMDLITKAKYLLGRKEIAMKDRPVDFFEQKQNTYRKKSSEFRHPDLMPDHVARIEDIIEKHKQQARADVDVPDEIEFYNVKKLIQHKGNNLPDVKSSTSEKGGSCRFLFAAKGA